VRLGAEFTVVKRLYLLVGGLDEQRRVPEVSQRFALFEESLSPLDKGGDQVRQALPLQPEQALHPDNGVISNIQLAPCRSVNPVAKPGEFERRLFPRINDNNRLGYLSGDAAATPFNEQTARRWRREVVSAHRDNGKAERQRWCFPTYV